MIPYSMLLDMAVNQMRNSQKVHRSLTSDQTVKTLIAESKDTGDLETAVLRTDAEGVKNWIRNERSKQMGTKSADQLKKEARDLCIRNWCRMTKVELIRAIEHNRRQNEEG